MRGADDQPGSMFSYISLEERVPHDHPLRAIRRITGRALERLSSRFGSIYVNFGRPSIAPEKLLRALLLQALYTVRSERQLIEQLDYNLLFRWFVGLGMDDPVWSPTTFTKNRDRLLDGDVASAFFEAVLVHADTERLLSDDHFTVDGTLLEAWASHKSFRARDEEPPAAGGANPTVDFHRQRRTNATHQSTTDPDARLYKKARGREARLGYLGHVLMEHRSGLIVKATVTPADGYGERDAAVSMIGDLTGRQRITVAGDKGYDTREFVGALRAMHVAPHIAQHATGRRSAVDGRTTRHAGYDVSQRKRKLVEQSFGWMKTVGGLRKLRHRGGPLVTAYPRLTGIAVPCRITCAAAVKRTLVARCARIGLIRLQQSFRVKQSDGTSTSQLSRVKPSGNSQDPFTPEHGSCTRPNGACWAPAQMDSKD